MLLYRTNTATIVRAFFHKLHSRVSQFFGGGIWVQTSRYGEQTSHWSAICFLAHDSCTHIQTSGSVAADGLGVAYNITSIVPPRSPQGNIRGLADGVYTILRGGLTAGRLLMVADGDSFFLAMNFRLKAFSACCRMDTQEEGGVSGSHTRCTIGSSVPLLAFVSLPIAFGVLGIG